MKYVYYEEEFLVGIRRLSKSDRRLFESKVQHFQLIEPMDGYWLADPILFEHDEKVYLFCEAYNKRLKKGEIACILLDDESGTYELSIVLSEPFHLSYPMVYADHGQIYMIPESAYERKVIRYRCVDFPLVWEVDHVLAEGLALADTTFLKYGSNKYYLTSLLHDRVPNGNDLYLYTEENDGLCRVFDEPIIRDVSLTRSGGKVFSHDGELIRPSQDCSNGDYGHSLNFNIIRRIDASGYEEKLKVKISPKDIRITEHIKLHGIHTYGYHERYEIIDLKVHHVNWESLIRFLKSQIRRLIRKKDRV